MPELRERERVERAAPEEQAAPEPARALRAAWARRVAAEAAAERRWNPLRDPARAAGAAEAAVAVAEAWLRCRRLGGGEEGG